jgi:hypothetical protein
MRKMLIISMLLASANAAALESFLGKVTTLDPTYLPGAITFTLDSGNATCPNIWYVPLLQVELKTTS